MDIRYDEESDTLNYILEYNYNNIEIFICEEFDYARILLGIHKDLGMNTINDYHLIASSPYFSWKVMRKDKHEIRPFLDVISNSDYETSYITKKKLNGLEIAYNRLNLDCSLLLLHYGLDKQELRDIRNKYNGNLVREWLNIKHPTDPVDALMIAHWMREFQKDVEWSSGEMFMYYLYTIPAKQIRKEFLELVTTGSSRYGDFNKIELPF